MLRKLNQLGAFAIKNSAYLLPETPDTTEDLQWIRSEVTHQGGEAWLFRVDALGGLSSASLREAFRSLRAPDYKQLLDLSVELLRAIRESGDEPSDGHGTSWHKLQRKFEEVKRIDFFEAAGRKELETIMETIATAIRGPQPQSAKPELNSLAGRTWVTRRGVKVDRIATAWLIRRFLDPAARFVFVDPDRHSPASGEIRFDMFEGEFTHEGDLCTFEVLLDHSGRRDPALDAIAQVVHDIDLKDGKHQRPETAGIATLIAGIVALHAADERRIEEGSRLWDATYAALRAAVGLTPP